MMIKDIKGGGFMLSDCIKLAPTLEFRRKHDEALKIIELFLSTVKHPAVSCGGGKDGTAALILAQEIKPDITVICADPPNPLDGRKEHLDDLFSLIRGELIRVPYDWNVKAVLSGAEPYPEGLKMKRLKQAQIDNGIDGIIWGCRNSESRARSINFARQGYIYRVSDGTWRCQPIAKWTAEDVVALAFACGYPVNPLYENLEGMASINDIHDGTWFPHGINDSKQWWIKKYYPQHYEDFLAAQKIYKNNSPECRF
ncbi:MAG: phosphoadenosine phosphosulfate reductase family protein [Oscillospiraceae bacterium]